MTTGRWRHRTAGDGRLVPDRIFDEPRLAAVYDALDGDRSDLDLYAAVAEEVGARSVLDIGCGTGTLACALAGHGLQVTAVDPAAAMLSVARAKPAAQKVRWVHGLATDLPPLQVDLCTMTGNVAQVFLADDEWLETLDAAHRALRQGGWLVLESRRPERRAWLEWNREQSFRRARVEGVGDVETWNELIEVALPFVTFRGTIVFHADETVLTSESTLRFRRSDEVTGSLDAAGFDVVDVREAPDRPGKEHVFVARRR